MRWLGLAMMGLLCASCAEQVGNFYRVDEKLWRSEQPLRRNVANLKEQGITHVVSLRRFHRDDGLAGQGLRLTHVPMRAGDLTGSDLENALRAILDGDERTLVHCWHGADRTGAVVAAYRMVVQGWEKEATIKEMRDGPYGHHAEIFPEIIPLLRGMDVAAMKQRVLP